MDKEFDQWVKMQETEIFQTEKFQAMGKADDYVFQALTFTGNGSHQLSIASTILKNLNDVPKDLKEDLKSIQQQLHHFNERLRNI